MAEDTPIIQGAVCPTPLAHRNQVVLGHGSGGKLSQRLIELIFLPAFRNTALLAGDDSAVIQIPHDGCNRLAFSTDSHVVWPLFFPGGDIGRLAVCGTVNDLAMVGASPLYLTAGFILEEGLLFSDLERIVHSMQVAAEESGISIIAGDTKVVQRGKADGVYINTAGVGVIDEAINISGRFASPGDVVILSGSIGDHGIAVLQARGDLGFEAQIHSDVAPLNHLTRQMLEVCPQIHVLRDPTRGGLATTLNEIARQSQVGILIDENAVPVKPAVASACEMLGFDPFYVANEGKLIAILPETAADEVIGLMRRTPLGKEAVAIGRIVPLHPGKVLLKTSLGSTRILDSLSGEMLPRIC
jgi:hydrogenase expression/formation protein HypE